MDIKEFDFDNPTHRLGLIAVIAATGYKEGAARTSPMWAQIDRFLEIHNAAVKSPRFLQLNLPSYAPYIAKLTEAGIAKLNEASTPHD